ncbi:MAG: hypothetical protein CMP51_02410 [Flavobacteriales bacterium]|nr:hypothetical protein [Flavobacteriales bacterium]
MRKREKNKLLFDYKSVYRFVVLNNKSFEEKASFKASILKVASIFLFGFFSIVVLTFLVISFIDPIKNLVPGKTSSYTEKNLIQLSLQVDSLINTATKQKKYINSIRIILLDSVNNVDLEESSSAASVNDKDLEINEAERLFRNKIAGQDKDSYDLELSASSLLFVPPIVGEITQKYSINESHFGIDIVSKKGSLINAIQNGRVVFSDWTKNGGLTVCVLHEEGYFSVYKHNSKLLKETGDFVKSGEPISVIGNTGSLSSGAHLHFELWKNGESVNPKNYISF